MNIFPVLFRLIDQTNSSSSLLSDTVKCIFNLLFDGLDRVGEQTVHPYFQELSRCGSVKKLWQLFIERHTLSIQQSASISLTCSFRSSPLPPQFALIIGILISQIEASGNNGESTKQLYSGGQSVYGSTQGQYGSQDQLPGKGKANLTPEEQRKRDMSMIINELAGLSCLADHQAKHAEIMNNFCLHVVMKADPTGTKSLSFNLSATPDEVLQNALYLLAEPFACTFPSLHLFNFSPQSEVHQILEIIQNVKLIQSLQDRQLRIHIVRMQRMQRIY